MYKEKFNSNYLLVSLILVDPKFNKDLLEKYVSTLKEYSDDNIQFYYAYRRNNSIVELNNIANIRWKEIFDTYLK